MKRFTKLTSLMMALILMLCSMSFAVAETTEAVQTGRVTYYDSSLMKRFGPRTIKAIEKLAYLLHPYYFQNPENSVSPWELGKIDVAEPFPAPLN